MTSISSSGSIAAPVTIPMAAAPEIASMPAKAPESSKTAAVPAPAVQDDMSSSAEISASTQSYTFTREVSFGMPSMTAGNGSVTIPKIECLAGEAPPFDASRQAAAEQLGKNVGDAPYDSAQKLGPLGTRSERIAALQSISQFDQLDHTSIQSDQNRCIPSSIVAATLVAEGEAGLVKVLDATRAYNERTGSPIDLSALDAVRERILSGEASNADVAEIQDGLYQVLNHLEHDCTEDLISGTSTLFFLQASPELSEMFEAHDMKITSVDTPDADSQGNHAVLQVGDELLYDPWPRTGEGSQVITPEHSDWQHYQGAADGSLYPFMLPFDENTEVPVNQMHFSPEGNVTFSADDGQNWSMGVIWANGDNTYQNLPGKGGVFEGTDGSEVTISAIQPVPIETIAAMDENTVLAHFEGVSILGDAQVPVTGKYYADGSADWSPDKE